MSAHGRNDGDHQPDVLGIYDTPDDLVEAIAGAGWCGRVWTGRDYVQVDDPQPALLEGELLPDHQVLEPSAGSGGWLHTLLRRGHRPELIEAMDVDPLAGCYTDTPPGVVATPCAGELDLVRAGFLTTAPRATPTWVLGNPPYNVQPPPLVCPRCLGVGQVVKLGGKLVPFQGEAAQALEPRSCTTCRGDGSLTPKPTSVAELHVRRALEVTSRHVVLVLRQGFLGSQVRTFGRAVDEGYPFEVPLFREHRLRAAMVAIPRPRFKWGASDNAETAILWWDREWPHAWYRGGWLRWTGRTTSPGSTP